ncbi:glycine zipper 2TM domain-containing protein [Sulfurospirillum arcachonense]|uniref:glycine zipper 2TM domain-containing protein n=1 Tax=Sulfurospirillum arcachonense TaxID=57666 RepID=UPI0004688B14|nr:glycine zipper 2TM domain-containing protein [Sulfurospirillum arcachonense]
MKKIAIILTVAAISLSAGSFTSSEKVKVTHSKPIYKTVTTSVPYQECWDEQVPVQRYRSSHRNSSNPFGTLIGGVAGGILGNQVGKGRGKTVATIGGALIGTMVGHNLSNNQRRDSYRSYETQQRCSTRYTQTSEERFVGYKNIGYYNGHKIVKVAPRKLRYISINKTIHY